jgi:hypothetical protein
VVAAKMIVYAGEDEEYFTFTSSESWQELKKWMEYRQSSGEPIGDSSWVMRDLWDTRVSQGRGFVSLPKKLSSLGVKRLMERAIWAQGLRKKLEAGKKRHPYQANHSLRKWFKTRCEISGMRPINIEKLMNHSIGISDAYYRATENELLEDYLRAADNLAVNLESLNLRKQLEDFTSKTQTNEYAINAKLQEKDDALISLSDQVMKLMEEVRKLKKQNS